MGDDVATQRKREQIEAELLAARARIFSSLTPWQKTLVARHPRRPFTLDYVRYLIEGFVEIHGDRRYADDPAIVTGFGVFRGRAVLVIGHQKGRDTKEKIFRNFGMPRPEGYRKALRAMKLAEKVPPPDRDVHRHTRRVPGNRRGGARPGRGDRSQPAGDGAPPRPRARHRHRRRGERRGAGHRRRRSRQHARVLRLLRDQPGGVRGHPLARRVAIPRRGGAP